MTEEKEVSETSDAGSDLRGTLIKRLAVAGLLVAVLLGVLAFFDYLATPEEPESPVYTQPVPVPPKKEVTQPVKPAETLPEPPQTEAAPKNPAEPPAAPVVEPAPKPQAPMPEIRPEAKMPPRPTPMHPPAPPALREVTKPVPPAPPAEMTAPPAIRMPVEAPVAPPAARPAERLSPVTPAPAPLRLFSGYVIQAGVFTSVQRAEELHARLTLNGIPSTLEARVQVGPFKNRDEALAAQQKMKNLGIEAVVIPPKGGR